MALDGKAGQQPEQALRAAIVTFADRLDALAKRRVRQKQPIEQRWIDDLLQYHGKYDQTTDRRLRGDKSKVNINKTRRKTNGIAAKLYDMLFPTDDRNWGIEPSPVPELQIEHDRRQEAAGEAEAALAAAATEEAIPEGAPAPADGPPMSPRMQEMTARAAELRAHADELQSVMEVARLQSDLMQAEIEDKFKASCYQAKCRDAIDWMCKIGTAILKGPVTGAKTQGRWARQPLQDEAGNPVLDEDGKPKLGGFALRNASDEEPSFLVVDPWSYFPDMDSGPNVADGEGDLERHLMNKKALRALARRPGFDQDAIRRLLTGTPLETMPSYLSDLRTIAGDAAVTVDGDCYQVWEYSGPITAEELRDAGLWLGDGDLLGDAEAVDPLAEINAVVWFCQGEVLFVGPYPMDSCETIYSVVCFEKDETCPFGYGVPYLLRASQRVINAAWRLMMDAAPLSALPQIIINKDVVEPEDREWVVKGGKVWLINNNLPAGQRAFDIFDIPSRQADLAGIIDLAMRFMDDETGFSQLAEGEQGSEMTKTSSGMAMLMNSTNVMMRRVVRNWDDDLTVPTVRRQYHWLMQHSPKEEIKGDFEVDARGSSVLLVRELQQQNLIVLANAFGAHPVYKNTLKRNDLMRMIVKSMLIPADELVPTDAEIAAADAADAEMAAQMAQGPQGPTGPDPETEQAKLEIEREKIDLQRELANMKADLERQLGKMKYDLGMQQLAEKLNDGDDDRRARLADSDADRAHKERLFAGEAAMTDRQQQRAEAQAAADRAAGDKGPDEQPNTGGGFL